jgi:hypothetical protein
MTLTEQGGPSDAALASMLGLLTAACKPNPLVGQQREATADYPHGAFALEHYMQDPELMNIIKEVDGGVYGEDPSWTEVNDRDWPAYHDPSGYFGHEFSQESYKFVDWQRDSGMLQMLIMILPDGTEIYQNQMVTAIDDLTDEPRSW